MNFWWNELAEFFIINYVPRIKLLSRILCQSLYWVSGNFTSFQRKVGKKTGLSAWIHNEVRISYRFILTKISVTWLEVQNMKNGSQKFTQNNDQCVSQIAREMKNVCSRGFLLLAESKKNGFTVNMQFL